MKYKTERREMMGNIKSFALYISILLLIVVVAGCGKSDKTKEDSKEEQIKKELCENIRYVSN